MFGHSGFKCCCVYYRRFLLDLLGWFLREKEKRERERDKVLDIDYAIYIYYRYTRHSIIYIYSYKYIEREGDSDRIGFDHGRRSSLSGMQSLRAIVLGYIYIYP